MLTAILISAIVSSVATLIAANQYHSSKTQKIINSYEDKLKAAAQTAAAKI